MNYIAINRIERRPAKNKSPEITNPGETLDVSGEEAEELLAMGAIAPLEPKSDTEEGGADKPAKETAGEKRAHKAAEKEAAEEAAAAEAKAAEEAAAADDGDGLL